jgi:hypothetical protein
MSVECTIYGKKWNWGIGLPIGFLEDDEREQMITSQACRTSYKTLLYSVPMVVGSLVFYPIIQSTIPTFPILVCLLIPFTQITAYFISLMKNI